MPDIVVVAAHFAAGNAEVGELEEVAGAGLARQQPLLNAAGDGQLLVEPLLGAGGTEEVGVLDEGGSFLGEGAEDLPVELGEGL